MLYAYLWVHIHMGAHTEAMVWCWLSSSVSSATPDFFETGSISQTKTHWLPGTNWPIGARDSRISVSLSCLYVKNIPQKRKVPLSQECSVLSRGSVFTWVWKIWTQASGLYAEHFPDSVFSSDVEYCFNIYLFLFCSFHFFFDQFLAHLKWMCHH